MDGRQKIEIWENVAYDLIKAPQKFGDVSGREFEVTVHTLKPVIKTAFGLGFKITSIIYVQQGQLSQLVILR